MNSTEWQKIKKIYNQTLDLPENERAGFLAEADQNLKLEVEKLVKTDEKDAFANARLAYLLTNLGEALANTNQFADALNYHDRAIRILEKLVETDKENISLILFLNRAYQKKGDALAAFRRGNEALDFYNKALKSNEEITVKDLDNMDMKLQLANDYLQIARTNINLAAKSNGKNPVYFKEACQRFEQSKAVFLDMQSHNLRTKTINGSLAEITQNILNCHEALQKD